MPPVVLDASALLALLRDEPGGERVRAHLPTSRMGAVNLAEVVGKLSDFGWSTEASWARLEEFTVQVDAFDRELARLTGELRTPTRHLGLSLGGRACFALALTRRLPVLTADRSWATLDLGVEVWLIR